MTDSVQYQADVHKIANEVDRLITKNTTARTLFTNHIDRFCKMVEDYGQVLQPYADKLKKAEKRIEKFTPEQLEKYKLPDGKIVVRLADVCPPPKGWIRIDWTDNRFVNISIGVIYRPAEPINPLLWFGIFGDANLQRKPEENESLMCYYVLLAIIHDVELKQPTDRPLFFDKYEGKWFQRNKFCEDVWAYYHYPNQDPSLLYHSATPQEKLLQLNRAFERVQADLTSGGRAGDTTQVTPEIHENKSVKKKQEGILEPKPPEFLQKILWLWKYGGKYWKLILVSILLLFISIIFAFFKFYLFNKISNSLKEIPNTPANYKKTSPSSQTEIIDPNIIRL